MKYSNKLKNKYRVPFILFCLIPPLISFLIWYVYVNGSAFFMAFLDKDGQFTLGNFVRFFGEFTKEQSDIKTAFRNTFITFGIVLASYPFKVLVSYFIYKKVPFYNLYRVLFFLPGLIFGVCTALVFQRAIGPGGPIANLVQDILHLDKSPELLADSRYANTVVLAHMVWLAFPGDLIIWGGNFAKIPEEVLESGRLDGTTWFKEFTHIILPMVWPTITLQLVVTFASIFSASGSVFLLTGGQYETMTLSAWMYITLQQYSGAGYKSNVYNYMSAVGLMVTIVAVTISLTVRWISEKYFNDVEY